MKYSQAEVLQYAAEEDVKFVRLAFCDIFGRQKNVSIAVGELSRAFDCGIAFDASAIDGFGEGVRSDLFLHPDPSTLSVLPWRPEQGRVIRMFCDITYADGTAFECDTRKILKRAVEKAENAGVAFSFGAEMEFYLFKQDESGESTGQPYDRAGYMDVAPEDKGENIRREICLILEQMGIHPESSHHEDGPGQNEIDFRYSEPLSAAENAFAFQTVVKTVAGRNGLAADFSPKPLTEKAGSGMHINISARNQNGEDMQKYLIAGILKHISAMTVFLNPEELSYSRLGNCKAPKYISWSRENRSQLIRVPAASGEYRRVELRSPDCMANPYLAFALLIHACLDGIEKRMEPQEAIDENLFSLTSVPEDIQRSLQTLPQSLQEAKTAMAGSEFVRALLPRQIIDLYCRKK